MFNFNHLYYFYMTARLGGVSKAAKILNTSQPSLSSQIKVLERALNIKLFQKLGRQLQLTVEGESVYEYCQRIFSTAEELDQHLKNSNARQKGQFKIGVTQQIERPFVADLVSHLSRSNLKQQRLRILTGRKDKLLESLREQKIDLVLTNRPVYGSEFMEVARFDMPVGLFMSRELFEGLRQTPQRNIHPQLWLKQNILRLVLPSVKFKLRHETDQFLEKAAVKPDVVLESDVLSVVVRSVVDGLGMGFLPVPYLAQELQSGSVVHVFPEHNLWQHHLYMWARNREHLDPLIKEVVAAMEKMRSPGKL